MYSEEDLVELANKVISSLLKKGIYCRLVKTVSKRGYATLDIVDGEDIILYTVGHEKDNPFWSNKLWDYNTVMEDNVVDYVISYIISPRYYEELTMNRES